MFVKRLFLDIKGSSVLMSSDNYYNQVAWYVYVT